MRAQRGRGSSSFHGPMSDLLKPDQIFAGRYRVIAFLAKGGFGAVYSAEQIDTEARVALKVLWPHLIDSDTAVDQFKLEAKLSNRIGSEHVVRVYDVGQEVGSGKVYLSMELLEGKDFEQVVKDSGPVSPGDVAIYFRQIASALEKAHKYVDRSGVPRPIVHRDLKPENLFLTHREAGDACVKILDFGLAKVLGESVRISNEFKGTPLFMSYEQASVGAITPQTDVWALGLIAFYLLTGRCYWLSAAGPDTPVTRIFSEVLSGPMNAPSERARALGAEVIPSPAFDAWFGRAVTRNDTRRFGSIGDCVAELLLALDGMDEPSREQPVRAAAVRETSLELAPSSPPLALETLRSVRPPNAETPSSQSFALAAMERRAPAWRGAAVIALGAATTGLGLFFLWPRSTPAVSSSGPDREVGAAAPGATAAIVPAGTERPPPLPLPERAHGSDAGAEGARPSAKAGEDSAGAARRARAASVRRASAVPSAAPLAPLPASQPEEDPYGSR